MALQLNYTDVYGTTHATAYARASIDNISKGEGGFSMDYSVRIYVNAQCISNPFLKCVQATADYDLDGDNAIEQAYVDAKTLNQFKDATDV